MVNTSAAFIASVAFNVYQRRRSGGSGAAVNTYQRLQTLTLVPLTATLVTAAVLALTTALALTGALGVWADIIAKRGFQRQ